MSWTLATMGMYVEGRRDLDKAGQLLDECGNRLAGIHERRPLRHALRPRLDDADLRDPIDAQRAAGRFQIDEDERFGRQGEIGERIEAHL